MERTLCWFVNSMQREAQEIARGLRRRDPDVLDHLIQQYHYRLFRYLLLLTGNRAVAEDLFQETWVRVLERGHRFDAEQKFEAWLFTIARNLTIDFFRRRQPQSLEALLESDSPAGPVELKSANRATPFDALARNEEAGRLAKALRHLRAAYREVLVLRFQEDLDLQEIAAVVGAPLSTVKSRLYRGLDTLRELLEESPS